jgi:hypothetical protein
MRTSYTVQGVFLVGLLATGSMATAARAMAGTRISATTPTSRQSNALSGAGRRRSPAAVAQACICGGRHGTGSADCPPGCARS